MEKISILEASRRLNLSQAEIRQYIRDGELKGAREPGPNGRLAWVVELPEVGWTDGTKSSLEQLQKTFETYTSGGTFSHWWWPTGDRSGHAHYVQDLGIEETIAQFLCGLVSDNIWFVSELAEDEYCPECITAVEAALTSDELVERFRAFRKNNRQREG
jgi:hypothetical protein